MSFGKNPHVAKAQAAEQKAADAVDEHARTLAYREAAHQWDRAASRENPGKKRTEYEQNAERNRALADGEAGASDELESETPSRLLN
jgi:hypothetical protein